MSRCTTVWDRLADSPIVSSSKVRFSMKRSTVPSGMCSSFAYVGAGGIAERREAGRAERRRRAARAGMKIEPAVPFEPPGAVARRRVALPFVRAERARAGVAHPEAEMAARMAGLADDA